MSLHPLERIGFTIIGVVGSYVLWPLVEIMYEKVPLKDAWPLAVIFGAFMLSIVGQHLRLRKRDR